MSFAKDKKEITRVTAGIIIALISAMSAVAVARVTTSAQADEAFSSFKLQTIGDISGLKAVNTEIGKHLDSIDRHLENQDGQFQSLNSYLLNKK